MPAVIREWLKGIQEQTTMTGAGLGLIIMTIQRVFTRTIYGKGHRGG
jgi:hypothetical protein